MWQPNPRWFSSLPTHQSPLMCGVILIQEQSQLQANFWKNPAAGFGYLPGTGLLPEAFPSERDEMVVFSASHAIGRVLRRESPRTSRRNRRVW